MTSTFAAEFTMTVDGLPVVGTSWIDVTNPADETVLAQAPDCSPDQLDVAVTAARAAFPAWSATEYAERCKVLHAMADAIEADAEPLRQILAREAGKTLDDARAEIFGLAYWLRGISELHLPETVNEDSAERRSVTRHVPLGVVGAIVPWNYPLGQIGFKLAPALLAGNTVVLKPSPFTPLATLRLGELLRSVVPRGVVNAVSGGDALGPWMTAHPGIDKISFTGSTATGRKVMAGAAGSLKRITLELGGNDPAIVLADIDVPTVAEKLFWGAFGHLLRFVTPTPQEGVVSGAYDENGKSRTLKAPPIGPQLWEATTALLNLDKR